MMTTKANISAAILCMFAILASVHPAKADDLSYTNWPSTQEWVDLTNDVQKAYDAYKLRYRAYYASSSSIKPSFVHPYDDYKQLADAIDTLSIRYVDVSKADADGNFEDYLAGTNHYYIPSFSVTGLHAVAGFDAWATPQPLKVWQCFDHNIQSQVWACLNLMVCTEKGALFTNGGEPNNRYAYVQDWNSVSRSTMVQELTDLWNSKTNTTLSAGTLQQYTRIKKGAIYWEAAAERDCFYIYTLGMWTGMPHAVDFYSYGASRVGSSGVFHPQGQDISTNAQLLCSVDFSTNSSVTSAQPVCTANFTTMPVVHDTSAEYYGFELSTMNLDAIIRWDVPDLPFPTIHPKPEEPDTDRDDLIEVPGDMSSFGPDSGSISWLPDQDRASVLLPLASPPLWSGVLPVHAYISQGGTTNLPFQYLLLNITDNDGCYQAYSLNTRALESGAITIGNKKKQAAVLRPRGNVVVFDFPWDDPSQQFSAVGYPMGINSNRTYVLRDLTPSNNVDLQFDLQFDSGITHRYNGMITKVMDANGMSVDVSASAVPGGSVTLASSASDAKYNVSLVWVKGQPTSIAYAAKNGAASISLGLGMGADGYINSISKTGLSGSDASISGNTIAYEWGTVARSGSGGGVTITTTLDNGGAIVEDYELNDARRLTKHELTANSDAATTTYEYCDTVGGRYNNGSRKNAKLKKITYPDASSVEYTYAADTGWLSEEKRPVGNGSYRITAYDYSHAGDSTANVTNLYERPRMVTEFYDTTVIGKTLYAYSGSAQTVIQKCTNAAAAWNSAGNLIATNNYSTNGLTNGLVLAVSSPTETSQYSYQIAGLSGSDFTALGKLTAASVHSTGQTVTNVLNAFGTQEAAITLDTDSRESTAFAVSTVDAFGRITQTAFLDGTAESYASWTLHGPELVTGIDGSVTTHEYFDNGRVKKTTRGDTGVVVEYEYDALGNVTSAAEIAGGDARTTTSAFDAQSRLISRTTPLGTSAIAHQSTANGTRTTTTNPDGGVLTEDYYFDGSLAEVQGSAAIAHLSYSYGVDDDGFYTEEAKADYSGRTRSYQNMLAMPCKTIVPKFGGGNAAYQSLIDQYGRYAGGIDPLGMKSLIHYNSKNRVSDSGLHVNGAANQLTPASNDRYQTYTRTVEATNGIVNNTLVYPISGNGSSMTIASSQVTSDGKSGSSSFAGRTNSWGRSTYGMSDARGGCYSETNTLNDGRRTVCAYKKWRLDSVIHYDSGGLPTETESHGYNGFGELTEINNSIHGITTYDRDTAGRITKITPSDSSTGASQYQYWAGTARVKTITKSDLSVVNYDFYHNGLLRQVSGNGGYAISYTYDSRGRKKTMTTWRNGLAVVTEWQYDSVSGLLERKLVDGVIVEQYDYRDNQQIVSIRDASDVILTCNYNAQGDLTGMTSSDGCSSIASTLDRLGRATALSVSNGISESSVYALDGSVLTNTVAGNGIVSNATLSRVFDPNHGWLVSLNHHIEPSCDSAIAVAYNNAARVVSVTSGSFLVQYTYTNCAFISSMTATHDGTVALIRNLDWDLANRRIKTISYVAGGSNVATYAYSYPTNSDRIAQMAFLDGTKWDYLYDSKGQLISGAKHNSDASDVPGMQFGYTYDEVGNPAQAGALDVTLTPLYSFQANNSNFLTNRVWGTRIPIYGFVSNGVKVAVNGVPAQQAAQRFCVLAPVNNMSSALQTNLTVWAVKTNVTPPEASSTIRQVFVAKSVEPVEWRATGAIQQDSRFTYEWNRFGRLLSVASINASPNFVLTFDYYADGRRARKQVWEVQGASTNLVRTHRFYYDSWNLIAETINSETGASITNQCRFRVLCG